MTTPAPMARPHTFRWLLLWAGYTAFAVAWAWLWIVMSGLSFERLVVLDWVIPEVLYWNMWAALTPGVVLVARRIGLAAEASRAKWALHLVAGPTFSALAYAGNLLLFAVYFVLAESVGFPLEGDLAARLQARLLNSTSLTLPLGLIVYALISAVALAYDYVSRLRAEEVRSAALNAQLAEAQLEALKMQLQPHFLFNALNTISSTLHADPATADRMLAELGDFLRLTLDRAQRECPPLLQEVDFVRRYLQIEKHRLEDRLTVTFAIEPSASGASVPYLILQPLVENAMRHGIAAHIAPGYIAVGARVERGELLLSVENSGPGLDGSGRVGIGLANTRARLRQRFGDAARLSLLDTGTGVRAEVTMPFTPYRPVPPAADTDAAVARPDSSRHPLPADPFYA